MIAPKNKKRENRNRNKIAKIKKVALTHYSSSNMTKAEVYLKSSYKKA